MAAEPAGFEIVPKLADWACSPTGPRLTALLGEFGMGKTVACQLLTQELLSRRRDGDPDAPLPLYFDLRNIDSPGSAGSMRLEALIDDMLRRAGENPPPASEVVAYVRAHPALVVFDGLDEVTNKLTTEQAIRLYRELLGVVPASLWRADAVRRRPAISVSSDPAMTPARGPRILVSCRTHFFRDVAAQRSFFTDMDRAGISADEDIQTFLMLPFSPEQIEAYLKLHLPPDDARRALELIDQTYDLRQLAERPILLRFIRETVGQLETEKLAGREVNVARLYDILVDQTFARATTRSTCFQCLKSEPCCAGWPIPCTVTGFPNCRIKRLMTGSRGLPPNCRGWHLYSPASTVCGSRRYSFRICEMPVCWCGLVTIAFILLILRSANISSPTLCIERFVRGPGKQRSIFRCPRVRPSDFCWRDWIRPTKGIAALFARSFRH